MPMAGEGSRFKDIGIDTPKPLIEFNEIPLFMNSLRTIDGVDVATRTFIVRKEHVDNWKIDEKIHECYPDAIVMVVEQTTRGAAETAFLAIKNLILSNLADFNDSVLIMDCDVIVEADDWKNIIKNCRFDGVLLSFYSNDSKYSYAAVKNGKVISTAEKIAISDHALTSPYFIKKIEYFVDAFHEMEMYKPVDGEPTYKEMYMSILYNFMIADGKKIILVDADKIISLGTPEELEKAKEEMK